MTCGDTHLSYFGSSKKHSEQELLKNSVKKNPKSFSKYCDGTTNFHLDIKVGGACIKLKVFYLIPPDCSSD